MAQRNGKPMTRFRCGLVVGKFSPLHIGHEKLINAALAQCEQVVVISYSLPELSGCEADKRRRWLATRFPSVRSLVVTPKDTARWQIPTMPHNDGDENVHRHFVGALCLDVLHTVVDAVFTAEDYGDGFAAVLGHWFSQQTNRTCRVTHVRLTREQGPGSVSGTLLRSDIHTWRHLVAPSVYADFVHRICLLGGESSGKSTLSLALADALGTVAVAEYGRECWEAKYGALTYSDMLHIAQTQVAREQSAHPNRFLVCDTSPLTTLFYSREMFGKADLELESLARRHYHTVVLCSPDFPFAQDGTRRGEDFRHQQHAWYLAELAQRKMPYLAVTGDIAQRVRQVLSHLQKPSVASGEPSSVPAGEESFI